MIYMTYECMYMTYELKVKLLKYIIINKQL